MDWQVNWQVWHWPWFKKSYDCMEYAPGHFARWWDVRCGFGPFQFSWYSKHD